MSVNIQVVVFAGLKDRLGWSNKELSLPDGASVSDAMAAVVSPELRKGLATAVNREYAKPDVILKDGDELAILPPVSGGAAPFRLTHDKLDLESLIREVADPSCGAIASFQGTSREIADDPLEVLEYEAYAEMAEESFRKIAKQAEKRFGVSRIAIAHRLGNVPVGETSVAIAVASPHRGPAFDTLRFVIDTLKETAPIWKKEITRSGKRWVEGKPAGPIGD